MLRWMEEDQWAGLEQDGRMSSGATCRAAAWAWSKPRRRPGTVTDGGLSWRSHATTTPREVKSSLTLKCFAIYSSQWDRPLINECLFSDKLGWRIWICSVRKKIRSSRSKQVLEIKYFISYNSVCYDLFRW